MNPLCFCGCGKEVTKESNRFLSGHNCRGRHCSAQHKLNLSESHKTKEYKQKYKSTMLQNNNVEFPLQSDKIRKQYKSTCKNVFGYTNPMKNSEIKDKVVLTNKKLYNGPSPFCSNSIVQKSIESYKEKTGYDNPMKNPDVKLKFRSTNRKNLGVDFPMQSISIREKGKDTCLDHFGYDNYAKTPEFREFARGQMIDAITAGLKDGKKFTPRKGNNELSFINELRKHTSYFIDNDAKIINYFPDGYIKELNLMIELDESHHDKTWCIAYDIKKDEDYKRSGFLVFRVKEKEWLVDQEQIIINFKSVIDQRIQELKILEVT